MSGDVRLQKFLSAAGVASRRKSEALITSGRVSVNGQVVTELGTKVDPSSDEVSVDGGRIARPEPIYVVMHKPRATVCTESDPEGRQRVHELLPMGLPRLFTVGRLDYDTEGLLIFTNDGEFASRLTSPNKAVPRVYEVKVQGPADPHIVRRWTEGVRLDDGTRTRPSPTEVIQRTRTNAWYSVVLTEGKNRQIHRMAAACGKRVLKLRRVAYGSIQLGSLKVGQTRKLTTAEVADLMNSVGMQKSAGLAGLGKKSASTPARSAPTSTPKSKRPTKAPTKPASKPAGPTKKRPTKGTRANTRRDGKPTTRPGRTTRTTRPGRGRR